MSQAVPFFPTPRDDELLYSVIARFHRHTCETSPKRTLEALFGNRSVRAVVDLPGHLSALAARLPQGLCLTAGAIAQRLHMRLGVTASRVRSPDALRRCPVCDAKGLERFGEHWWRRAHQLPGVLVCPDHCAPLIATDARVALTGQHVFLAADDHPLAVDPQPTCADKNTVTGLLRQIAERSARLLSRSLSERMADRSALLDALAIRDLATPSGTVRQRRLLALQADVFSPLATVLPEALRTDWLTAIVRRRRHVFHPLHRVLLDLLLDAAPIEQRRSVVRARRFLADDRAFEARLRTAVAASPVLTCVARDLGVDANTVRRHAARLALSVSWKPLGTAAPSPTVVTEPVHRADWIALQNTEPTLSRKALRARLPAAYAWLRRHDPAWLEANSPPPRSRGPGAPRVDWSLVDKGLAAAVGRAATALLSQNPPVRITLASLERAIGRPGWIGPRRGKLPLTAECVRAAQEDVAAFQARRFSWAQATLLTQSDAPEWRVRRLAGLRRDASGRP